MRRAQLAEEERANYQAAMQNLQQRNQYLQQQEEQRLDEIARHRQQRLQEEQAQKAAQARHAPFACLPAPINLSPRRRHACQGLASAVLFLLVVHRSIDSCSMPLLLADVSCMLLRRRWPRGAENQKNVAR